MYEQISLCVIKFEFDSEETETENCEEGATSAEHPSSARCIREREKDRGLRHSRQIIIETYANQIYTETMDKMKPKFQKNDKNRDEEDEDVACRGDKVTKKDINSKDGTPIDDVSGCSDFPTEISFFSGNPSVEVTHGIIHLYKKNERKELRDAPSNTICLLAVPATMDCHDLLSFLAPCHSEIQHVKIIRDGSPNQFMVLLEFRSNEAALEFYRSYNGIAFNSLEPEALCHAVWVSHVERANDGNPPPGHTELPTCPVCLERMDESVDGVLTILCNHAFHANCLIKWGDSRCPVCRHVQTPELMEDSVCMECEGTDSLWICLICGHVGCGRYQGGHAAAHYRQTNHTFALQLGTSSVWDYAGDNFVHRLFQNKTDGKLVASHSPSDEGEEKIDSMQLEFTYLLTSQLDTQRKFYEERMERLEKEWKEFKHSNSLAKDQISALEERVATLMKEKQNLERKLTQNNNKLKELQKHLSDEKEISKALQNNQTSWHLRYNSMERQYKDFKETKEAELAAVKDELRDVMFYLSAQSKIAESELKDELVQGSVVVPEVDPQPSTSSTAKANRRKKKH